MAIITHTQQTTCKSPQEALITNLMELQVTYIQLLESDEIDAAKEAGETLRCYATCLTEITNPFAVDDEDEEGDYDSENG